MSDIQLLIVEIRLLSKEIKEQGRILKKLVRGEVAERDEIITSKKFQELESITQRQMYHILDKNPHLKSRVKGVGLLINYTKYKKILK